MKKNIVTILTILIALPIIGYSVFAIESLPENDCVTVHAGGLLVYDSCLPMLGTSLTTINGTDTLKDSRSVINNNFSLLSAMKLENSNFTGSTGITYAATGTISFDCSEVEGTGINCSGESITLDATGAWTGTFDGQEGSYYLDFGNMAGTIGSGTWNGDSIADAYIANDITASNYLALTAWYATTTDILDEGSTNLYYTPGRVYAILSATTSLPNLDITESQISDLGDYATIAGVYATNTLLYYLTAAGTYAAINATTSLPNLLTSSLNNDAGFITSSTTLFTFTSGWGASLSLTGVLDWNTSTTTGENGIDITTGCYAINGTCISGGGSGSGTVSSGTPGYVPYYADYGTVLTSTSTIYIMKNGNVGIGSTSPISKLVVDDGSTATTTRQIGDSDHGTNPGRDCYWNGSNFTIIYFNQNSITPIYATSTTCNI